MISHINNGELGLSVRTKLNSVIDQVNAGSGASLPIARYVYLVNDAADQARMGGTASNVYITAQEAYDAAVIIQAALGGSNIVVIRVGATVASTVGGITITSNWNTNVFLVGLSSKVSAIGALNGTNASGTGRSFGTGTGSNQMNIQGLTIASISTTATGTTGSGGSVSLYLSDVSIIGTVDVSTTNGTNTTGSSGIVYINATASTPIKQVGNDVFINSIFSRVHSGTSGITGEIKIEGTGIFISDLQILNAHGSSSAFTSLGYGGKAIAFNSFYYSGTSTQLLNFTNTDFISSVNISGCSQVRLRNCNANLGNFTVIFTVVTSVIIENSTCYRINFGQSPATVKNVLVSNGMQSIGDNSTFVNCNVTGVIDGIGTGCKFIFCVVTGGALTNTTPVNVTSNGSIFDSGTTANVSLITNETPQVLTESSTITWDYSVSSNAQVTLTDNRSLSIIGLVPGRYGTIKIIQDGTGGHSLALPANSLVANAGAGLLTLSTAASSVDTAVFYWDGTNFIWVLIPDAT